MEAATALLASASATSSSPAPATHSNTASARAGAGSGHAGGYGGDRRKKRKNNDGRPRSGHGNTSGRPSGASAPFSGTPPWPTPTYNPWTGVVQAWPLQQWRSPAPGVLGSRPPSTQQQAMTAFSNPAFGAAAPGSFHTTSQPVSPALFSALHGLPSPANYGGGGDWFLDTGATSHMASSPGPAERDGSSPM